LRVGVAGVRVRVGLAYPRVTRDIPYMEGLLSLRLVAKRLLFRIVIEVVARFDINRIVSRYKDI
jgi:hypothetical protein